MIVSKNILIANGMIEINKNQITSNELLKYINKTKMKLKKENYISEEVNIQDIISFCNMYSYLVQYSNNTITFKDIKRATQLFQKYFDSNLNDNIKAILKKEKLYILPIKVKDNIVFYYIETNDIDFDKISDNLFFDTKKEGYILDISLLREFNINIEKIIHVISKSQFIKKEELDLDKLNYLTDSIDHLNNSKFQNIEDNFSILELIKLINTSNDIIRKYIEVSNSNDISLNDDIKIKLLNKLK